MSEDKMIHFWDETIERSPCGVNLMTTAYTYGSPVWSEVTCGECKLEQPYVRPAEYKIPEHVTRMDTLLAETLQAAAAAHKRLAEAKEFVQIAETTLAGAQRLLSLAEAAFADVGMGTGAPEAQRGSEEVCHWCFSGRTDCPRPGHPKAPVFAVDIRTDDGYAEGMNKLSKDAQSALINGGHTIQGTHAARLELAEAGLIGINGGLTQAGDIARKRAVRAAEDKAFG